MRITRYYEHGEPASVLQLENAPAPRPGPCEAVVAVEAAPVHLADLYCMRGIEIFQPSLPATPGFEGIGTIKSVGNECRGWSVGARVFLPVRLTGGTWRQEAIVPADQLWAAPDGDAAQLCLMPINGATAYLILDAYGDLEPGDWVVQNAANSNCGRYLIQLAKVRGVRTVNVVRRPELVGELEALGANVVLLDGPNLAERVREATGNAGIRLGVDAVNGAATTRIADCLADGGTVLCYGRLTGQPCMLPPETLFLRDIRLLGFFTNRTMSRRTDAANDAMYRELVDRIRDRSLHAQIAARYPLSEVRTAVAHAGRTGTERAGKIILLCGE